MENLLLDSGYISLPSLYKIGSKGTVRIWTIMYGEGDLIMSWGEEDGDLQTSTRQVETNTSGRTPLEQSELEAKSRWKRKMDVEGYREDRPRIEILTGSAMLATKWDPKKNQIKPQDFPIWVQRKYNGVRCLAFIDTEGNLILRSRGNMIIHHMKHIREECVTALKRLMLLSGESVCILDGELYSPDIDFDTLNGTVRRKVNEPPIENEGLIEYYVFDCNTSSQPVYRERYKYLIDCLKGLKQIHLVKCKTAQSKDDIIHANDIYQSEGYEGVIIRRQNEPYVNARTKNLYKYKGDRLDAEGIIIGAKPEKGRYGADGPIVWHLRTTEGKLWVRPKGSHSSRIELYKDFKENPSSYLGRLYRYMYSDKSSKNTSIFSVGIGFVDDRRPEDVGL